MHLATGSVETTKAVAERMCDLYRGKRFLLVDTPGAGTPQFPIRSKEDEDKYQALIGLVQSDGIVIVSSERFTEIDARLFLAAQRLKKPTFAVRTKADVALATALDDYGLEEGPESERLVIERLREDSMGQLPLGTPVYVVSSLLKHSSKFDLPRLKDDISDSVGKVLACSLKARIVEQIDHLILEQRISKPIEIDLFERYLLTLAAPVAGLIALEVDLSTGLCRAIQNYFLSKLYVTSENLPFDNGALTLLTKFMSMFFEKTYKEQLKRAIDVAHSVAENFAQLHADQFLKEYSAYAAAQSQGADQPITEDQHSVHSLNSSDYSSIHYSPDDSSTDVSSENSSALTSQQPPDSEAVAVSERVRATVSAIAAAFSSSRSALTTPDPIQRAAALAVAAALVRSRVAESSSFSDKDRAIALKAAADIEREANSVAPDLKALLEQEEAQLRANQKQEEETAIAVESAAVAMLAVASAAAVADVEDGVKSSSILEEEEEEVEEDSTLTVSAGSEEEEGEEEEKVGLLDHKEETNVDVSAGSEEEEGEEEEKVGLLDHKEENNEKKINEVCVTQDAEPASPSSYEGWEMVAEEDSDDMMFLRGMPPSGHTAASSKKNTPHRSNIH
eukprot:CAMPEP_0184372062 /NCGR_PEP_ID=MMETSP1089-20130417/163741_1 /TAXON_ID=38269 ORGANISM="Gloeochaete wittrockiana, Strain SAG46.84" /NCGR_SAMPLE_ID=MMETSP1089 /ASSEMBLY_ACC=CAM_ASM_000445 /LENGTH=619 /DNA_ID=CAMNT_0026714879 /DNA_START=282 /DNA_END=2142 /DNA_ORIENTATION=+